MERQPDGFLGVNYLRTKGKQINPTNRANTMVPTWQHLKLARKLGWSRHFYALLLACAMHLALAFSFGVGAHTRANAKPPTAPKPNVMKVQLRPINPPTTASPPPPPIASVTPLPVATVVTAAAAPRSEPTALPPQAPSNLAIAPAAPLPQTVLEPVLWETEPQYFTSKQLSEKPQVLQDVAHSLSLTFSGIETQTVILRLMINEHGNIDRVHLDQSTLGNDVERVVIAAFSNIKFQPGKIDGVAVKSQLKIEVLLENAEPIRLQHTIQH
jgi:outer membrane biosynthesis protein TonB